MLKIGLLIADLWYFIFLSPYYTRFIDKSYTIKVAVINFVLIYEPIFLLIEV